MSSIGVPLRLSASLRRPLATASQSPFLSLYAASHGFPGELVISLATRRANWSHPAVKRPFSSTRLFSAAASAGPVPQRAATPQANDSMALDQVLTPEFLKSVRDFWYEHLPSDDDLIVPGQSAHMRWYAGGTEFDQACLARFEPALEAIKASGIQSSAELLRIVQPMEPCDWLSLVLLLDQIPRNCYRGASAHIVFTFFDPLALGVAQAAVAAGIPDTIPQIRWQFAFRKWFGLPFEHSEDLAMHEECLAQCESLARDVEMLLAEKEDVAGTDEYRRRAWRVVHQNEKVARGVAATQIDFAKRHEVIIKRFGRYPHRNEALGRESTAEEREFLEAGGDTFSPAK